MQNKQTKEKLKLFCREKYGCDCVFQSEQIKEKIKQTNLKLYGAKNPFQSEQIKEKIKQTNLEKRGCEYPMQNKEVQEKRKATYIKNYNVDNPMKNKEIHLKAIRSSKKRIIKYNWETNEEVICTANYEAKVVDYWNENKIRFQWQIPFENKEDKYVYFVDAYLPDKDIYIEIKRKRI
jgi:hypothetical protein